MNHLLEITSSDFTGFFRRIAKLPRAQSNPIRINDAFSRCEKEKKRGKTCIHCIQCLVSAVIRVAHAP